MEISAQRFAGFAYRILNENIACGTVQDFTKFDFVEFHERAKIASGLAEAQFKVHLE